MAASREVADRVAAGMVAAWRARVSHIEGHALYEHDGVVVALSGLPDPELSVALVEREPSDALEALGRAERWFRAHGCDLGVDVERGRHPSVERAIVMMRLERIFSRPAMAVAVDRVASPDAIPRLDLRHVETRADLDAMVRLETAAFGTAPEAAARLLGPGVLERPDVRLSIGAFEGEVVAMSYVHTHERALGVFGVATAPEVRRRGIGTAITAFSILEAGPDADLAWLQPSEMGLSVYRRMGFEPVAEWEVWVRPHAGSSSEAVARREGS